MLCDVVNILFVNIFDGALWRDAVSITELIPKGSRESTMQ